jgi:beta-glucosidase
MPINPFQPLSRPPRFLWGAATSSHQIEGYNDMNDWWVWEHAGHIEGGARSGPATDHWNRFREDIKLAADLGLNTYRFSVEWSRIEPEEGRYNREAVHWYRELLGECEKHGLLPMLTLHHFTSPRWFAEKGGFTWQESPKRFAEYTKLIAKELGPRVPLWCTFNEPMVLAVGSYIAKFMPPATFSPADASLACRNILKAHVFAYDILHSEIRERTGPWHDFPLAVGIAHNVLDFHADRAWHPIERVVTGMLRKFYNRSWLDAITGRPQHFGIPGLVPRAKPVRRALDRRTADFIGINYYTKAYVKWRSRDGAEGVLPDFPIGLAFARRREPASDLGWAFHPGGLGRMLRFVKHYGLPIYITENGIADANDKMRKDYLLAHLGEIASAIRAGMDIRGYYHWSLLDNFEWKKGFGPRFGLYAVNYDTFDRTPRESAGIYKKIIDAHRNGDFLTPPRENLFSSVDPTG